MGKGGGGGGAPTQSTAYQTNVPEYAKPYVTNMLEATQKQLFNTQAGPEGTTEITGFKPYTPYSSNVNDYVAAFSPMQQQAQRGTANLQVPGQYNAATALTGQAALGSLGAADQSGGLQQQALGYGQAGSAYGGAGAQYGSAGAEQARQAAALTAAQAGMYGGLGSQAGQQAAGLSNLYGGMGSQAGQQAAGQSALYGGLGAQSGERYAGQSLGYGGMGAGLGLQAAGAGGQYAQQATSPAAMQAYMNPYVQSSLAPQLAEIQRQADITGTQQRSGAAKSGAFGGSREALMSAENQRAAQMAKQQAIGQGYDKAFQQAQQAQQYGANLGLQGLQAGMQGTAQGMQGVGQAGQQALAGYGMGLQGAQQAGQQAMQGYGMGLQGAGQAGSQAMQGYGMGLQGVGAQQAAANLALQGTAQGMQGAGMGMQGAQAGQQGVQGAIGAGQYGLQGLGQAGQMAGQLAGIGGQQLAAQQGILSAQAQMGGQQQAQEQQKINQAIQDYATQQQYPMMQLGLMSNMLRGLPMQATNVQSYQAQAPLAQQTAGLLGAYNAYSGGRKAGGVIKDYKEGGVTKGIPGYKSGVLVGLEDDIDNIAQMDSYAPPMQKQLPKLASQTSSPGLKQMIGTQQAEDAMGQKMAGVAAAPTGGLGMNMATGGIVPRFAEGDLVQPMYTSATDALTKTQALEEAAAKKVQERLSPEELALETRQSERLAGLSAKQRKAERMNEALAFLKFGSTPGGLAAGAMAGGEKYMLGQADIDKTYEDMNDNLVKSAAELKKAKRLEAKGDAAGAETKYAKSFDLQQTAKIEKAKLDNAITKQNLADEAALKRTIQEGKDRAKTAGISPTVTQGLADRARQEREFEARFGRKPTLVELQQETTNATKGYDEAQSGRLRTDALTALGKWEERQLVENKNWLKMPEEEKAAARAKQYNSLLNMIQNQAAAASAGAKPTAPTAPTLPKETKGPSGEVLYLNPKDGLYYATKPR
jgi:hypothetical protein